MFEYLKYAQILKNNNNKKEKHTFSNICKCVQIFTFLQIFTMVFYVDPSIDSDWYFDNLKVLVFTYEFSEYKS